MDGSWSFILLPVLGPHRWNHQGPVVSVFDEALRPHSFFIMHAVVLQAVPFPLHWQTEVNVTLKIPKELLPLMKLTMKSNTWSSLRCIHLPFKYSHLAFSACFKGLHFFNLFFQVFSWLCLCLFYAFVRWLSSRPPINVLNVHFPQFWLVSIRRRLKVAASRKVKEDYVIAIYRGSFLFKNN